MLNELDYLRTYLARKGGFGPNLNEVQAWRALAGRAGVNSTGNLNELTAMRSILAKSGINASGLNEIGCLNKLCFLEGCVPTEGLNEFQLLAILANPSLFFFKSSIG